MEPDNYHTQHRIQIYRSRTEVRQLRCSIVATNGFRLALSYLLSFKINDTSSLYGRSAYHALPFCNFSLLCSRSLIFLSFHKSPSTRLGESTSTLWEISFGIPWGSSFLEKLPEWGKGNLSSHKSLIPFIHAVSFGPEISFHVWFICLWDSSAFGDTEALGQVASTENWNLFCSFKNDFVWDALTRKVGKTFCWTTGWGEVHAVVS